jgi:hypothetical protein
MTSIAVNGSAVTPPIEKGYAVITRNWRAGDKIDLVLPMKVQRIKASDKIAATAGRVALRYGPLIYSVEQADQDIAKVLSPDSALTSEWKADLLEGVMAIKGTWADGSALTAIPNYARDNRTLAVPASGLAGSGNAGSATAGPEARRRGFRAVNSIVWIKDR